MINILSTARRVAEIFLYEDLSKAYKYTGNAIELDKLSSFDTCLRDDSTLAMPLAHVKIAHNNRIFEIKLVITSDRIIGCLFT